MLEPVWQRRYHRSIGQDLHSHPMPLTKVEGTDNG